MCMAIKTFHDGDRLIISIDGLPRQSSEEIAKVFLTGLVSNTQAVADSTAVPTLPEKESIPEVNVFPDGPYKGFTPKQVMDGKDLKEQDKICIQFSSMLDMVDDGLRTAMLSEGQKYLKSRFKDCDTATYGSKLSDTQLLTFYTRYVPFLEKGVIQYLLKRYNQPNWNAFLFQESETLRDAVALILKSFQ